MYANNFSNQVKFSLKFQIVIPFLILHAEEDKLCDVEGSRLMYKKAKSKDKQLITFPNAGHNLVTQLF
jgi:alpha-beta hydrolase superfamily lysophospholipase